MIAALVAVGLALVALLSLLRLLLGPTLYDRALAMVALCIEAVLMSAALAVANGRSAWIDVCFALSLAALVLAVATLKFFRARTFQAPLADAGELR